MLASYEVHKYTLWAKYRFVVVVVGGGGGGGGVVVVVVCNKHCDLKY